MSSEVIELERPVTDLPADWKQTLLGDALAKSEGGGTPSRDVEEYWNGDIPWASVKDVVKGEGFSPQETITSAGLANSTSKLISAGTNIFAARMGVGAVVRYPFSVAINQDLMALTPSLELDPSYLFYWLQARKEAFVAVATGTTVKGIRKDALLSFSILLPPLDEQRRIAEVLRSVDEAIAAAALVVTQATEAFEALLADLFARYGDASATLESYCLPRGLQTGPFGSQLKAKDYAEDGIPVIMPVDLTPEGIDFSRAKKATLAKSKELVRHILHPGDVLFARRGEIGRCGLYLENDPVALCGTGCLRARLDTAKIDPALAYFLIQSRQARDWLRAHAVGATMPNLNTTIIGDVPMPDIPMGQQKGWVDALLMIEGTRRINQRALVSFQRSKSTLMSNLLSGRVRVPA